MELRIATRKSKLAQVQTEFVMEIIDKTHNIKCEKVLTDTLGDKRLDVTLDKIGGKGLFIKELEQLILDGHAEAGVHSMKDMPYELPEGFIVAAMPIREDVRDAFVSINGVKFKDLKKGAKVGTSSNRRASQLKILRPDIEIVPIRGNVQTRIDKIKKENLDGIILAAAGLKRLGMDEIITDYFEPHEMIPAIGQGALGIEIHESCKDKEVFTALDDYETRVCVEAERSFMAALKGDCHAAIGAYAELKDNTINMIGIYEVNGNLVRKEVTGPVNENIKLGEELASLILNS
ncbi:hydroxymethylbilane synthase [Clostridium argentinense]|uniref:hydroxymethylbilane synthase n=1 Tax=Clostridium argentinense TaxID=29341 RepID=UPI00057E318A|nr:hydroxymethylbilane synthase [Clostridium argentinense]ARC87014.1 hydroxymethylbilane synthase [Clostridium argentinense]NFF40733.1 hydroxymethylbilane synthase [Clostridium argentinense]NFP51920.1 hydroxymethylbilane synthase [Clostridium argentinense]NFP74378.1 hydroxymethylbilane synthase [Clostridium argentinense]NFP77449.1 hydroxymethylbilane synthase [Clostridium argentinense]